jgi:hypothetical protein
VRPHTAQLRRAPERGGALRRRGVRWQRAPLRVAARGGALARRCTHHAACIAPRANRRFGEFERFIYDFLVGSSGGAGGGGGGRAGSPERNGPRNAPLLHSGGEGLRLKLQTPLYVADALMQAAGLRLDAQITTARRELASLDAVRQQLARFKVGALRVKSVERVLR